MKHSLGNADNITQLIILLTKHILQNLLLPVTLAQLVESPTADQGVASSIPARLHTLVEIDHEIISMAILLLRVVVSYNRKYIHEVTYFY